MRGEMRKKNLRLNFDPLLMRRYTEGRRHWTTLINCIRQFTRYVWIYVKENGAKDLVEKKSAINLS